MIRALLELLGRLAADTAAGDDEPRKAAAANFPMAIRDAPADAKLLVFRSDPPGFFGGSPGLIGLNIHLTGLFPTIENQPPTAFRRRLPR